MKRLLIATAALAAVLVYPAAFAQVKISDLPAASALGGTEATPTVQGGVTSRMTPAQINTYVRSLAGSWTGAQAASGQLSSTFVSTSTVPSILAQSTAPQVELRDTDSAANGQRWNLSTSGTTLTLNACVDNGSACGAAWQATRNAGAVTAFSFGNATDNPGFSWLGSGAWTVGGGVGTSSQVLTSNGPGAAPTWQTPSAGTTLATGTFTPSCTFGSGMSACAGTLGNYIRVGNQVQVNMGFNGTGASATQTAAVATPINTANTGNVVVGVCTATGSSGSMGRVTSNGTNSVTVTLNASQTVQIPWSCVYQYTVN